MTYTAKEWNNMYTEGNAPWDREKNSVDDFLNLNIDDSSGAMALDIGCGSGNEMLWLAKKGYNVTGVDISSEAIQRAQEKCLSIMSQCSFITGSICDILGKLPQNGFDIVLDRRCFHFLREDQQELYISGLHSKIAKNGKYILIVSSEHESDNGPIRRRHFSENQIRLAFEDRFNISQIKLGPLENHEESPLSYFCCMSPK